MDPVNNWFDLENLEKTTVVRKEGIQMKKSNFRKLSLFLAVVFIISMMPAAVFAAEDEHVHAGDCCAEAAAIYATCTHPSMTSYFYGVYTGNCTSTYHVYEEYVRYTCTSCKYMTEEPTGNSWTEAHSFDLSNGGVAAACTVCGYLRDA